ncbi:MAG: contractile injection system protein, VgrG/Pvc8 family, partial [Succinivibrio sp.]
MANFKNSVEAEFQNSSINLINSNYILSVDLTEGISIPFVLNIEFLTDTKQKISALKALLDQAVTVTLYQYSSDKSIAKSYVRDVHGVVTAFEDHGVYNIDNGNAKRMYRYTLTVMPEIIRLSSKSHQRSFTDKSVVQVIDSILGEYGIQSDSNNNNLWTDRPDNTSLVFTQTKETDLEFLNKLCSDFGINYTVEYDRKSRNNIYSFSRGYITRKDSSVALNVSMTPDDKLSFFDQHVVDDIVTSCAVAYEDKNNDEKRDFTYDFNFLFNDVDSDKKRKSIRDYCSKSRQAFKDNLNEKTLIRANDLSYVPGVMLQVKDYDDSATYTIARTCLKIYSLEQDPKVGNFAFRQTLLCLNKLNKDLLGSVYQLPRINLDSSLADIRIHEDPQIGHDSEFYSSSVNDYSFCVGTVSNESGEIRDKDGRDVVPASGGNGSVPTKFYLKTDSSDVPAVVHYLHSQSGINNYLSDFPKLGQKVVALKLGGNYLFYAYLPHSNDIERLIP